MIKKTGLVLGLLILGATILPQNVEARKYGIYQREAALTKEINSAFKANQLTSKEADDLREMSKKIEAKEQKMKDKNAGKLSYEDKTSLERELNKLSDKLHKKVLEKRVQ